MPKDPSDFCGHEPSVSWRGVWKSSTRRSNPPVFQSHVSFVPILLRGSGAESYSFTAWLPPRLPLHGTPNHRKLSILRCSRGPGKPEVPALNSAAEIKSFGTKQGSAFPGAKGIMVDVGGRMGYRCWYMGGSATRTTGPAFSSTPNIQTLNAVLHSSLFATKELR